tara:strand:- start:1583 stop:2107 length:525 start_codon:yes stop_codon:yes gene_type:complete
MFNFKRGIFALIIMLILFSSFVIGTSMSKNKNHIEEISHICYTDINPSRYFGDDNKSYLWKVNDFPIKSDNNNNLIIINQEGNKIYGSHVKGTGSMKPSIGPYSIYLYILNFTEEDIHIGDIVVIEREEENNLIHRIVEITEEGYITKGDNNNFRDFQVWNFEQIKQKVVGVLY